MHFQKIKSRSTWSHPLTALLLTLSLTATASGEPNSWPQIRGANGDGVAVNAHPPLEWSEDTNIKWKIPILNRGHSSPVVHRGLIYLASAVEENTRVEKQGTNKCFVADRITIKVHAYRFDDGSPVWDKAVLQIDDPAPVHTLNSFATPTPVADGDFLYCDFGTYGTACLESNTGSVVWTKRLPIDHEVGPGSSPVVYQDLMILVRDGREAQYITALDKKTGKPMWKTPRPPLQGTRTDMHKSFATPIIVKSGDQPQLVVPGAQWLVSYDPGSGRELWRCNHGKGFSIAAQASAGNGLVIYCTGFSGNHLRAVKLDGSDDVSDSHVAWKCSRWTPTIPSPVLAGKLLFWVSDTGTACCADPASGEIIWHKSLRGRFRASPIHAADRLYLIDTEAKCHVLTAGKTFELLQENQLPGQEVTATPAFVDRSIILRTHTHLYRIDNPR